MPDVNEVTNALYLGALENDGATVWLDSEETSGYLVGVPNVGQCLNAGSPLVLRILTNWVTSILALKENGHTYSTVGSWVNHLNDGRADVYFDVCEVFFNRENALSIARERGELAIWDIAAKAEVKVS